MFKDKYCKDLSEQDFADLKELFRASFSGEEVDSAINHYTGTIDKVLVMYEAKRPAAFLFYQIRKVSGANVLHLSLSGKNTIKSGAQKRMGAYLFYKYVFSPLSIAKLNAFVTVSNNPRSYFNMRSIAEAVYPDVLEPSKTFEYSSLYRDIAEDLGLSEADEKGILRNRMQKLGFQIKEEQTCVSGLDRKGKTFMDYIDNDASHGVLVMTCMRPITDIPKFYSSQALKFAKGQTEGVRKKLIVWLGGYAELAD